jgi:hypothetical protein
LLSLSARRARRQHFEPESIYWRRLQNVLMLLFSLRL